MLQGYRLIDGDFVKMLESGGQIQSEVLGANLRLVDDELEFIDAETGARWLDRAEARVQELEEQLRRLKLRDSDATS